MGPKAPSLGGNTGEDGDEEEVEGGGMYSAQSGRRLVDVDCAIFRKHHEKVSLEGLLDFEGRDVCLNSLLEPVVKGE